MWLDTLATKKWLGVLITEASLTTDAKSYNCQPSSPPYLAPRVSERDKLWVIFDFVSNGQRNGGANPG